MIALYHTPTRPRKPRAGISPLHNLRAFLYNGQHETNALFFGLAFGLSAVAFASPVIAQPGNPTAVERKLLGVGAGELDVRTFGAVGDGVAKDTAALQGALDACGALGGGTVVVPPGTYLTGTLWLRSHVNLRLEHGAVLKGSPDLADYNAPDAYPQNWNSKREGWSAKHLLIAQYDATGVSGISR